ncbi:MAG: hypothetical protein IAG10_11930, partial [Planctomycetaceae bacterium]|nr:hypothetical protein [Planctomycetaceae bacterium]
MLSEPRSPPNGLPPNGLPPNGLPPNGLPPNGIPGVNPPEPNGDELDPLLDELPREDEEDDDDRFAEPTLIFEYMALRAVCTAAELLPLMSTTRTVRFAARASSSIDWTRDSICRKSDSLEEIINVFVRASTLSV